MTLADDQFYTGLVAEAYAPLRGSVYPAEPYARFVREWGEPGLEIGCGHGEPLLDLVADGLDVVGLDSSADMLALAASSAADRGLEVQLVCARMEQMDLGQRFGAIYLAGPTFQLVVDEALAQEALLRIAQHLLPTGRALVPLFIPNPIEEEALGVWKEHQTPSATLAFRAVEQSYRPAERRVDTVLEYRRGTVEAPIELVQRTWSLRWYEPGEFEALATQVGLAVDVVLDGGRLGRSVVLRA